MSRLDAFTKAVYQTVEGEAVALESVPSDPPFHIRPRKFSKKQAAEIQRVEGTAAVTIPVSLQSKLRKLHNKHGERISEDVLEEELNDEEVGMLMQTSLGDPEAMYRAEHMRIMYGVEWQDMSDEPGPMTDEIADLIQESPEVTDEVLQAVAELNPPLSRKTPDSSET